MLEIEIDGKAAQVPDGSSIMDAAELLGAYIPHFCYHKKLSIAANCRMCLVQVEKAPKPLPACATPVTNGMKVFTHSDLAVKAQKGVMEFLLINHPLDCPICDQGGECQLQDLSVGYGGSVSRYREEKRVVIHKDVSPLISMKEMARCIHCTRCVRFGQEIAGIMELGMINRNVHSEITSFVGKTVDSELSGNMIDLCPVGALTSKPFRYSARSWELQRRRSVSPHDSLGSNLVVQTKHDRVMRVLPFENEEINECWLSDKDRFSYEGLNSPARLLKPMVRVDGTLREVDWNTALDYVSHGLKDITGKDGGDALGILASPHATLEELYLLHKLARSLGCGNIDFRLRRRDFSADGKTAGIPWLGMKLAEVSDLDAALIVGGFPRKEQPLLAQRLRQAAKRAARFSFLTAGGDDQLIATHARLNVSPADLPKALAGIVKAAASLKKAAIPAGLETQEYCANSERIAQSLIDGEKTALFLGNMAEQHPQAALLHALAQELANITGARLGFFGEAANSVGAWLARAIPSGHNAYAMLEAPRKAYLLFNAEPEFDCHNPRLATAALKQAALTVAITSFKGGAAMEYADALLPLAAFTETSGTFVNTEGRAQSFNGVATPPGEARPGWKILRVLGNLLGISGFSQNSSEEVRHEIFTSGPFVSGLDNRIKDIALNLAAPSPVQGQLQRIADVPIHFADPLVRRAPALQLTRDASAPAARIHPETLEKLGIANASKVRVRETDGNGEALFVARADATVPAGCARIAAAHPASAGLGDMFAAIRVEGVR
ncbi:MAG: NADH-quinone oxidoreductase subunit NuoG [Betaproteobacteria bacterium]|nr:NADH-quinone oxidoreductase subunit NuoG [Betaproteobacteria bacterium]